MVRFKIPVASTYICLFVFQILFVYHSISVKVDELFTDWAGDGLWAQERERVGKCIKGRAVMMS